MTPAKPAPTIQQIRDAVSVIHEGVHNPNACPIEIAAAHTTLARGRTSAPSPVDEWLRTYLADETTAHGPDTFRDAVNELAQHFKLPPASQGPPPDSTGEQQTLFD